ILRSDARTRDADLRHRVELLRSKSRGTQPVAQVAAHWRRQLNIKDGRESPAERAGELVALAYPDRIAQRRPGARGQFRWTTGRGAGLPETDPLAGQDYLAVAALDAGNATARIFLAAPLDEPHLRAVFSDHIQEHEFVTWDAREQAVLARRQRRLG